MAGAYCKFCGNRCFVYRIIPDGPQKGWAGHLATCAPGMAHDREKTGHDHTTATNPVRQQSPTATEGDPVIDAYTDHDDYMDDEDDGQDEPEEWQPGECDNCYGGDENGITATGPLGPLYCACRIGQGADAESCRCGPPADGE